MLKLVDDRTRYSELLNRLNTMRKSKAFCDITILVDNKEFLAHKVILASSSDYFLCKFTEDAKCERLFIDMNRETFNLLLNYFYTSNLCVQREMVPGLFVAAKYLKVRRVVKSCSQYLAANLSLENVLNVREAVSLNNSEQLCHSANEFIKDHMDRIISSPRIIKLNMDIIVEAVPKKESDFHLSELVIDWLEYAIIDGNMTLTDFTNENFVLFLTKDNSLVQYNEISSHKFPSTFLKDYFNKFCSNQKSMGKRMKHRSKERSAIKVLPSATGLIKTTYEQVDLANKVYEDCIMISSDDSIIVDHLGSEDQEHNRDIKHYLSTTVTQGNDNATNGNSVLLNFDDIDTTMDDDDLVSPSARSKISSSPEEESCVIAVESTECLENDCVFLKVNCIAKVYGKIVCISLHVKSVVEILNQGINDGENTKEMSIFYGLFKQTQSMATGSESTASGMSSSSVSAASSMLHVDCIAAFNTNDDITNISSTSINDPTNEDQSSAIQKFLKNVQNKVTSLQPCALLSTPRCASGLVNVDDKLMAIGGFNRGECLNSVELYQPSINKWNVSIPMSTCRARFVAIPLSQNCTTSVYAIGGSDGYKDLATVERFDLDNQLWNRVANLKQARSYHGGCVVTSWCGGLNKCVVVGGCCGPNSLRCCEIYDGSVDIWSPLNSMKTGRSQAGVSSINQQIFVVGGTDSWKCLASGESMDLREGKWNPMPELSSPRRGAALVSHGDKLYLFGGSDGQSSLRSLEIFDPIANQWYPSASQMKQLRANVCGCVLSDKLIGIGGFTGKHFLDTMECLDFIEPSEWSMFVPNEWSTIVELDSVVSNNIVTCPELLDTRDCSHSLINRDLT